MACGDIEVIIGTLHDVNKRSNVLLWKSILHNDKSILSPSHVNWFSASIDESVSIGFSVFKLSEFEFLKEDESSFFDVESNSCLLILLTELTSSEGKEEFSLFDSIGVLFCTIFALFCLPRLERNLFLWAYK